MNDNEVVVEDPLQKTRREWLRGAGSFLLEKTRRQSDLSLLIIQAQLATK